jgi:hypothetical protein
MLGNFFTAEPRHDWDNVLKRRIGVYTGEHKEKLSRPEMVSGTKLAETNSGGTPSGKKAIASQPIMSQQLQLRYFRTLELVAST